MKLLKESIAGLPKIAELSDELKNFLKIPKVQEAFINSDINYLLYCANKYNIVISELMQLLYSLDIDVLKYLDYVPNDFLSGTEVSYVEIPDNIKEIGFSAFAGCQDLKTIIIPDSVTSIGHSAFWGCNILENITIPDSVINIGDSTFRDCYSLTSITIPDRVTSIIGHNFFGCSSLTDVTIGKGVTSIGYATFYHCETLTSINYTGTKNQWAKIQLGNKWNKNSAIQTIHCTDGDIKL